MGFKENEEARSRSLSIAARREMESWSEGMKAKREESEGKFRTQCQDKKAYDEAQSAARRSMGRNTIGERFW